MYKAAVRMLIRRNIRELNEGRYHPALAMFAPDAELSFPGDNTWSRQHRPSHAGRAAFPTHRGKAEIEAFLRRYVDNHIHMEVEDILVNGPRGTPERPCASTTGLRAPMATTSTQIGPYSWFAPRGARFGARRTTKTPSECRPSTPATPPLPRSTLVDTPPYSPGVRRSTLR